MPITPDQLAVPVRTAIFDFDNDDIIALPTTPLDFIATPGVGKAFIPDYVFVRINSSGGFYDNYDPTCSFEVRPNNTSGLLYRFAGDSGQDGTLPAFLGAGDDVFTILTPRFGHAPVGNEAFALSIAMSNFENRGWRIFVSNGELGNFTGGHSANFGKLTFAYRTLNLNTGLFE